jgi:hypothetical protein
VVICFPCRKEDLVEGVLDGNRLDCLLEYSFSGLVRLIDGKPPTLFSFLKKHGAPGLSKTVEFGSGTSWPPSTMLEVFEATGSPGGFPFVNLLPPERFRETAREFLHR